VHAGAHRALAYVLCRAGRAGEARRELEQAVELWERYGYRVEAEKTSA
jgi:Flp pilus assembly protein TadD